MFPKNNRILVQGRGHVSPEVVQVGDYVFTNRCRWKPVTQIHIEENNDIWKLQVGKHVVFLTGLSTVPTQRGEVRVEALKEREDMVGCPVPFGNTGDWVISFCPVTSCDSIGSDMVQTWKFLTEDGPTLCVDGVMI